MISSVIAIAKTPSLNASSRAVSLVTPESSRPRRTASSFALLLGNARRCQPERRLPARCLRVPGDNGRDDAADAALPALRTALLVRGADGDGDLRRLCLRGDRRAARVRERLRRAGPEAGADARP